MELRTIGFHNLWEIVRLSVKESQKSFVASNTVSLLEAYAALSSGCTALPFGLYEGEQPVGFVMFGYGKTEDGDEPDIAEGNYCLWRFMIDERFQGKGLGRKALEASLRYLQTFPCGEAGYCWLSYEPENTVARALYQSAGFIETGATCGNERVAVLELRKTIPT
ncbi:MAG: GNAT family N-acetyltransferase [Provencibacterium sp.]|jgi:diamine N-acetyltransferase|nr:GNAT family N-acetyltransferase [Provencibacterium sp.]